MKKGEHKIWITLALVGYMIYLAKKNGGTLSGNPHGYKVSVDGNLMLDMLVPAFVPNPVAAAAVKHAAKNTLAGHASRFGIHLG